ncbi:MAG: D-alanine--D-alanine ligase family protein [Candidatus Magasanikbacteria bacterium]
MKNKKKIGVIFGGKTAEHDVSIITAHTPIIDSLQASNQFEPIPIYISPDGHWYSNELMNDIEYFQNPNLEKKLKKENKVELLFDEGLKIKKPGFFSKTIEIDVAFPAMHGTYGEDGSLPGLLRMADVPFVGCDIFASAAAMDKVFTKQLCSSENIPIVPFVWFTQNDWKHKRNNIKTKINNLTWPLFVKPVHLGSSIAISKVENKNNLEDAIEVAFHYDNKVLIEESIENLTEVTLPILGNEKLKLGAVEKPEGGEQFFNFEEKYLNENKQSEGVNTAYSEIPADIKKEYLEKTKHLGKRVYRLLDCSGIARVDFLIDNQKEKVYVNEVNTLPGSLYQHNWKQAGLSNLELVTKLIELAQERYKNQENNAFNFESSVLQNAGGPKIDSEEED